MRILAMLIFFSALSIRPLLGQDFGKKAEIVIGVREYLDSADVKMKMTSRNYNFLDAFENELAHLLRDYIEENSSLKVRFVKVAQTDRLQLITDGVLDALLFSFSKTSEREAKGISFSYPYLQNKAIILVSYNQDITINSLGTEKLKIGYIENGTGETVLRNLKARHGSNLIMQGYSSYELLMEAINNDGGEAGIDAAVGDVSRFAFDLTSKDLYMGGELPLPSAKVRDEYAIAVSPNSKSILPLINEFVLERGSVIKALEDKWLDSAIESLYQDFYRRKDNYGERKTTQLLIIVIFFLLIVMVLLWIRNIKLNKKDKTEAINKSVADIISIYQEHFEKKFRAVIEDNEIIQSAIEVIENSSTNIYYLGSGGMLSNTDPEIKRKWQQTMHECLTSSKYPNLNIRRVVDLPDFEIAHKPNGDTFFALNKVAFEHIEPAEVRAYVEAYTKWLLIIYHDLVAFPSRMSLFISRGAPLWGYGMVTIIGDKSGVMFTSHRNEKIGKMQKLGTTLVNLDWIDKLKEGITGVQKLGERVEAVEFRLRFLQFGQLDEVADLIKEYVDTHRDSQLDEAILKQIEKVSMLFSNKFV